MKFKVRRIIFTYPKGYGIYTFMLQEVKRSAPQSCNDGHHGVNFFQILPFWVVGWGLTVRPRVCLKSHAKVKSELMALDYWTTGLDHWTEVLAMNYILDWLLHELDQYWPWTAGHGLLPFSPSSPVRTSVAAPSLVPRPVQKIGACTANKIVVLAHYFGD